RELVVIASEKAEDLAFGLASGEHRTRDNPKVAVDELVPRQIDGGSAEARPKQPRALDARAGQRNHPLYVQDALGEQPADRYDVLITQPPHNAVAAHRLDEVDVHSGCAGRMRA